MFIFGCFRYSNRVSELGLLPLFPVPLLIPVFPILATLQYLSYPFMSLISQNFLLVSVSLVLYCTCGSLSITLMGTGHHLLLDVPDLFSGLSFVHMVGLSLVHSLLGFLDCENWARLN